MNSAEYLSGVHATLDCQPSQTTLLHVDQLLDFLICCCAIRAKNIVDQCVQVDEV